MVRRREQLATILRCSYVRDKQRPAGLEKGREDACRVFDRREVVVGRTALSRQRGMCAITAWLDGTGEDSRQRRQT